MDFLSVAMTGLIYQYNHVNSLSSAQPQNRLEQLNGRQSEICRQLQQTGDSAGAEAADRKQLVHELKEVNSQLQQTQYQEQTRKLQEQQLKLLAVAEKKKWERYLQENKPGPLFAASMSKLVSAGGKYNAYSRSGTPFTVSSDRDGQQSASVADDVDRDVEDSRTLGIMAADAARRRKRQKTREAAMAEQENKIKDSQHPDSVAYLLLELQKRKRKKVIDAYI